jgi:uncharacterized membrane protein
MRKQSSTSKLLLASAVAGLLAAGALGGTAQAAEEGKVKCYGVNACKGQGACGGKGHSCAGKNACKGQGYLELDKDECLKQGGRLTEEPEKES